MCIIQKEETDIFKQIFFEIFVSIQNEKFKTSIFRNPLYRTEYVHDTTI